MGKLLHLWLFTLGIASSLAATGLCLMTLLGGLHLHVEQYILLYTSILGGLPGLLMLLSKRL